MPQDDDALAALLPTLAPLKSASDFDSLAKACALVAAGKRPAAEAAQAATTSGTSAAAQAGLVSYFLSAASMGGAANTQAPSVGAVLPSDRAAVVEALASEGQGATCSALSSLSLGHDELVDVAWQRSVVAAAGSEQQRAGGVPLYVVTLTTRARDGTIKPRQFTASTEELTDLVRCVLANVPTPFHRRRSARLSAWPALIGRRLWACPEPPFLFMLLARRGLKTAMRQVEREIS